MSTTQVKRFDNLRLPAGFTYLDHPFIDHDESDYVITLDGGVEGDPNHPPGWKVTRPITVGRTKRIIDVLYTRSVDAALTFVQMVTNTNEKLSFGYEVTKPRSAVWYDRN